jgi:hypothetical protein
MNTNDLIKYILDYMVKIGGIVVTEGFRIAMRQVYTYAVMDIVVGVFIALIGCLFFFIISNLDKRNEWDDWKITWKVFGIVAWIVSFIPMLYSIRFFMNPEWYAIKFIIEQVK